MLRTARNVAFLVMVCVFVLVGRAGLFASWDSFCLYWEHTYDCSCSGPSWEKVVHCDFTDEGEEWQDLYQDLWYSTWEECNDYCEGQDYKDYLAWYLQMPSWCFDTWGDTWGQGSIDDSWTSCDCSYFCWCTPVD